MHAQINNSNAFATPGFTSLVRGAGPSEFVLIYQKYFSPSSWPPFPLSTFQMTVSVSTTVKYPQLPSTTLKADDEGNDYATPPRRVPATCGVVSQVGLPSLPVRVLAAAAPRQTLKGFGWSLVRGSTQHRPLDNFSVAVREEILTLLSEGLGTTVVRLWWTPNTHSMVGEGMVAARGPTLATRSSWRGTSTTVWSLICVATV